MAMARGRDLNGAERDVHLLPFPLILRGAGLGRLKLLAFRPVVQDDPFETRFLERLTDGVPAPFLATG